MVQIAITGEPGCGKTTVAKLLVQKLGVAYVSTGEIQRQMASQMGISTLELNKRAETDRSIDEAIDSRTIALGRTAQEFIIDSRLAWRFMPHALKIFLTCPIEIAARRVKHQARKSESYESSRHAAEDLKKRFESENLRFQEYYGATLRNLRNFDIIVDSSTASPEQLVEKISELATSPVSKTCVVVDPRCLIPTSGASVTGLSANLRSKATPKLIRVGSAWATLKGHAQVAQSIRRGEALIVCGFAGQDDEVVSRAGTARSIWEQKTTAEKTRRWRSSLGLFAS